MSIILYYICLRSFGTVDLAAGRASGIFIPNLSLDEQGKKWPIKQKTRARMCVS